MKTFRKTVLLVSLFIGIVLPTQFVFAAECWCGLKNTDCSVIALTGSGCESDCKTTYKENFDKILSGSVGTESACTIKHNAFLAKEADATKAAATATATPSTPPKSSITPTLNIEIPGLTFSPAVISASTVKSNFLADYINAIYLFLIGTGIVFVIIMVMIGGLQYTIGAGSEAQIGKGKERIRNAITGLVLLLCTFLILKVTNPQLVTMKMVELENVAEEEMPPLLGELFSAAGEESSAFDPSKGTAEVVDSPNNHKKTPGPPSRLTDADIKAAAANAGIDQCFLWSFAKKESGGKLLAIGHDEAYPKNNKPVNSRRDFLMSGKKYSGKTFSPPTTGKFDYKTMNSFAVYNDDTFQPNKPPLYGLDWRFRHGIGYLQLTIFPENNGSTGKLIQGPNGPEWARKIRGKWFTVTDLLNADTALEASIRFVGPTCGKKTTVVAAMKCTSVSNAAMGRALAAYQKCPLQKTMTISAADLAQYPAKASN